MRKVPPRSPAAPRAPLGEGDDGDDDERRPRRPVRNLMTPDGYKRLAAEHDRLRGPTRREVVAALAAAAAEGDRSENAEYIYRKRQLRQIDSRVRFLARRLDCAAVVDPREQARRDRVFFGTTVEVEDDDGAHFTYRLVGTDEIGFADGDISWQSPVGQALLGKGVGDEVTVRLAAGERVLTVVRIG